MIHLVTLAAAAAPGCDPERIDLARELVSEVEAVHRTDVALALFAEACPGPVADAAAAWVGASDGFRARIEAEAVLGDVAGWMAVCPAGPGVLATALRLASSDARDHVFRACGLGSTTWFDAAQWRSATGPALLALLAGARLEAARIDPDTTRLLVRAMIGAFVVPVSTEAPPRPYLDVLPPWETVFDEADAEVPGEPHEGGGGMLRSGPRIEPEAGTAPVEVQGTLWPTAGLGPGPGAASCPPPDPTARGPRCEVQVFVDDAGRVVRTAWDSCPRALRPGMQNLLTWCRFSPGDGSPVPVTWTAP
jgi:hypothetical protein